MKNKFQEIKNAQSADFKPRKTEKENSKNEKLKMSVSDFHFIFHLVFAFKKWHFNVRNITHDSISVDIVD